MTTTEKITRARTRLLLDHPFFGTLVVRLPMIRDDSAGTLATNGRRIRYNEGFVETLTEEELVGCLAHEVLHVANGHIWRCSGRDLRDWNISADYAINYIIREVGMMLPACALANVSYDGLSAEEIYKRIHQEEPPSNGTSQGPSEGGADNPDSSGRGATSPATDSGGVIPSDQAIEHTRHHGGHPGGGVVEHPDQGNQPSTPDPGGCGAVEGSPAEGVKELEAEWQVAVSQAAMTAQGQGHLPAGLKRMVEEILNPKVPWQVVLRDFVERAARNDYNWTRPNRRYISQGIILPSLISEELPEIVVAIDNSGSMGQHQLNQFAAEVSGVLGAYDTTIQLVWCDAAIQKTETLTRADLPLRLSSSGGGGTNFRPVFDWVMREGIQPACLIYLTDMRGTFPEEAPDYPVLWVRTTEREAPFGDVVDLN